MHRPFLVLATLLILPAAAVAQKGGGTKSRATEPDKMFDKDNDQKGPALRPRDVEDVSPLKLLIDKRKDLKLTDAQLDAIKKREGTLREANAPLLKGIDSLVHELKPPMNMTDEAREHMRSATNSLRETVDRIRTNYDAAAKEAMSGFDAEQTAKANELLAKQREEADKSIREKMSTGGGKS